MQTLTNPKPFIDVVEAMPMLQQRLNESTEAMTLYLKYLKDEKFERQSNETKEEALLRAEGISDRLGEIIERKKILVEISNDVLVKIEEMKEKIEVIEKSCEGDEDHICDANNELIDEIVKLYDKIMEEKIVPHQAEIRKQEDEIKEIRSEYEENKKKGNEGKEKRKNDKKQ